MIEFFGDFSWPVFVELFPNYLLVLLTAVLLFMTIYQIKAAREDANRRAAFEYFVEETNNNEYRKLREDVFRIIKSKAKSDELLRNLPNEHVDMVAVRKYLNRQEALAAGILNGGICENYSRKLIGSRLVQDWMFFEPYVCEARLISKNDKTFGYFCKLAQKWHKEGVA